MGMITSCCTKEKSKFLSGANNNSAKQYDDTTLLIQRALMSKKKNTIDTVHLILFKHYTVLWGRKENSETSKDANTVFDFTEQLKFYSWDCATI